MKQQEHIPVFYEGQDDLVDILATSMASVCYNTKSFIDFYILDCGICNINKKLLESMKEKFNNFSIEFIPIDLKQFAGLKGWGSGNFLDCYSRLLIPDLKPDLDKVIYLDSDVVAHDDIKLLWDIDLGKYAYAAVPDLGYDGFFQNNCINKLGLSNKHIYPNAGVLLLDTKKCRKLNFTNKILKIAKDKKENILVIIEDLLSIFFGENNYKRLDNRYNLTDRSNEIKNTCADFITDDYLAEEWKNIVIQHLSPGKTWKIARNHYNGAFLKLMNNFWFYAEMTPYINGMSKKFEVLVNEITSTKVLSVNKKFIKLFGFIPLLKMKQNGNKKKYKLFGFIPLLTIKEK